jgi:hypothetical protein
MSDDSYKIIKRAEPATLWVHPHGPVKGELYVQERSDVADRPEHPIEVLNRDQPFVVVHLRETEEVRFYGKRSIVRVHHQPDATEQENPDTSILPCDLHMMDGSTLSGTIREFLLPEHRRLFDYLNQRDQAFLRLHLDDGEICLVNKAYIVCATERGDGD